MIDEDLITAVRESFTDVHSDTPVERIVTRSRAVRARRRVPALTAALAVAAAAAVAVTSLLPGSRAGVAPTAPQSLRARLLAAIDAARGDILMTSGGPSGPHTGSGYELTYPWSPRPGQQVRIHTVGWGTNGKLFQDAESIFTMPAGHSAHPMDPVDGGYDLTVTQTFIVLYPAQHAWGEWHHNTQIVGLPVNAAGMRRQLADGQFKIIRRGVLDGHKAIELGMTGLSRSMIGLHTTAALLWVDAASYLPLREVLRFSTGRVDVTDYKLFPPTAANLAKLSIVIPPGYHRTWLLPGQRHYKPPSQAQQRKQQRQALAFVACMHRDGFPQLPDGWSGNIGQLISAGINPNSPRLNAALTKCGPW
jgi:hypothetical protein